jgi:hypothetical protein
MDLDLELLTPAFCDANHNLAPRVTEVARGPLLSLGVAVW